MLTVSAQNRVFSLKEDHTDFNLPGGKVEENETLIETGIREGEKIHEEMISSNESQRTIDLGNYYAILNSYAAARYKDKKYLGRNFSYSSNNNKNFLTVEQLKKIIRNFPKKN